MGDRLTLPARDAGLEVRRPLPDPALQPYESPKSATTLVELPRLQHSPIRHFVSWRRLAFGINDQCLNYYLFLRPSPVKPNSDHLDWTEPGSCDGDDSYDWCLKNSYDIHTG